MTEDALLRSIAAAPRDPTPLLALADWLHERGDGRHELLRGCEGMRRVPVYSDEYWRLKARRDELRPGCAADWLAATGCDGGVYDPVFRDGVPADWRGRWRVTRAFTERWGDRPMPDVGGRMAEIQAVEARLGVALPASLREYVAFAHDVFPWPDSRMVFRDGYSMVPVPGHPAISFLWLAEGNLTWAVRLADLGEPDPPVHTYVHDHRHDGPYETRPFVANSEESTVPLSEWLLGYTEGYCGPEFGGPVRDTQRLRRDLEAEFPIRPGGPDMEGFGRYEHPAGILAYLIPMPAQPSQGDTPSRLCVKAFHNLTRRDMPGFLQAYAPTEEFWLRRGCPDRAPRDEARPNEDIPF